MEIGQCQIEFCEYQIEILSVKWKLVSIGQYQMEVGHLVNIK